MKNINNILKKKNNHIKILILDFKNISYIQKYHSINISNDNDEIG